MTIWTTGADLTVRWVDKSFDETEFEIQRARYVAGVWSEWTGWTVPANSVEFTDPAVPDGQYAYLVRSRSELGVSEWVVATIVRSSSTSVPAAPAGLTAVATGGEVRVVVVGHLVERTRLRCAADTQRQWGVERVDLVRRRHQCHLDDGPCV